MADHGKAQGKPFEEIPIYKKDSSEDSTKYREDAEGFHNIHLFYSEMYEKFGPLVKDKRNPERTVVHVFDAQDMNEVYAKEGKTPVRPSHRALARYRESESTTYSCAGFISNDGDCWLRFRRLFGSTLVNERGINNYLGVMEKVTEDLMATIAAKLDDSKEVDITDLVLQWSLDTIGAITLNVQFGCLSAEGNAEAMDIIDAAKEIHKYVYLTENFPDPDNTNYEECANAQRKLESIVQRHMHQAIADIENSQRRDSLLAELLARNDRPGASEHMSQKDALTMIVDTFTGGTDTVSMALIFTLYNLAINPSVQDTLLEKLLEQFPSKDTKVGEIVPFDNTYALMVLKESLRVNATSIGNGREIPKELKLSGYRIPAKTPVILHHQVASMQEKYFSEPLVFNPLRWDSEESKILSLVTSFFGNGKRKCIGSVIAKAELTVAISRIIRKFKVSYHHEPVETVNRLVNVPVGPVKLRFIEREN